MFTQAVDQLREASETVTTNAEVVRYMQDIVIFLRLSRAVAGGVTAKANDQFIRFAQSVDHGVPDNAFFLSTDLAAQVFGTPARYRLPYPFNCGTSCTEGFSPPHCRCHSRRRSESTVR